MVTRRSICVQRRHVPQTQPSSVPRGTLTSTHSRNGGWWPRTGQKSTTPCQRARVNSKRQLDWKFSMLTRHRFGGSWQLPTPAKPSTCTQSQVSEPLSAASRLPAVEEPSKFQVVPTTNHGTREEKQDGAGLGSSQRAVRCGCGVRNPTPTGIGLSTCLSWRIPHPHTPNHHSTPHGERASRLGI